MPRSLVAKLHNALLRLRYNYLVLPGAIALAFAGLGHGVGLGDQLLGEEWSQRLFPAGGGAARTVLSTIATSLITVAGVTFSITIVSLQLVSQQFTPRALRGFLGDRLNQSVAGVFIGVFLYCLVVIRSMRPDGPFLSGLSVLLGLGLAFVALAFLLVFIHHMGHSIQISTIARKVAHETLDGVECVYPGEYGRPDPGEDADALVAEWREEREPTLVYGDRAGFVQSLDDVPGTISGTAFRIELLVAPGDFVTHEHPLAAVWTRRDGEECATAVRRAIAVGDERDSKQDVSFGLRQLADIAIKALSPSVNDPTTATTCIGYMQAIVEELAQRPLPARVRRFPDEEVTLVLRRDSFDDHLQGFIQVSRYAEDARVVVALLSALARVAQAARRAGADDRVEEVSEVAARVAARALRGDFLDDVERKQVEAAAAPS